MGCLELEKRSGYSKIIFSDTAIVLYKKDREIIIPLECIDYIKYAKPSLLNFIGAMPDLFGGTYPGRLEIYLKKKIEARKCYLIKIKKDEIVLLPQIYKIRFPVLN